ncbi:hypothetical protein M422DRAFT_777947 [Sphaerobolus stellatus SS14]|uniref:BTB domain-containing protein n=1 Tax=Sphaerobolus stellatus (strain SS14) TaxID=990650 RepID=A0A0C9W4Z4_SPHS4|nr:hypothetical protein M422DRAFT_777947 [Sphaerobolus stellatus SS14]
MSNKRDLSPERDPYADESSPNRPLKRLCTPKSSIPPDNSAGLPALEPGYTRSNEYYFRGTVVILLVEKTAFRVFQELFLRDSRYFADLFNIPEGQDDLDIATVHLTDTVAEWKDFLDVFYGSVPPNLLSASSLGNVLRIAIKYTFDKVFKACMARLQQIFPRSLREWKKVTLDATPYARIILEHNLIYLMPQAFHSLAILQHSDIVPIF